MPAPRLTPVRLLIIATALVAAVVWMTVGRRSFTYAVQDPFVSRDPNALRVLFIGNSHTFVNDLPVVFGKLVQAGQPGRALAISDVTRGGIGLADHLRDGTAARVIAREHWTFVVLQEQSARPISDPASFRSSVGAFDALVRAAGAATVIYEVPAPEGGDGARLHARYVEVAEAMHALLVPAGPAWTRARAADGKLVLHQRDGYHPSAAGTYLTACVFYAALVGARPDGLPDLGLVTPDVATELQRAVLSD